MLVTRQKMFARFVAFYCIFPTRCSRRFIAHQFHRRSTRSKTGVAGAHHFFQTADALHHVLATAFPIVSSRHQHYPLPCRASERGEAAADSTPTTLKPIRVITSPISCFETSTGSYFTVTFAPAMVTALTPRNSFRVEVSFCSWAGVLRPLDGHFGVHVIMRWLHCVDWCGIHTNVDRL